MAEAAREIELKLEIEPNDVVKLEAHPLLERAAPRRETQTLTSVYFDTADLALHQAGVSLRVRDDGGRYLQTIKTGRGESFDRGEWEIGLQDGRPDLDAAAATELEAFAQLKHHGTLAPVFQTRIRRTVYWIHEHGAVAELALDQGEIVAGSYRAPISELEIELKRGEPAMLFRLARSLSETVPLRLGVRSKAERGYGLLDPGTADPVEKASELELEPDVCCATAFQIIGRSCLHQLIANIPATCAGDAEGLHQMRIGLRRLRAALGAFASVTKDDRREAIKRQIKWMTKQLGPARDLDVLIQQVAGDAATPIVEDLKTRRELAYAAVADAIHSARFRLGLLDLAAWIELGAWSKAEGEGGSRIRQPAAPRAATALAKRRRRIRKRGKQLRALSHRERHKLRLAAKALRYATEFFAGLFPGRKHKKRREALLSALKRLQDALGELNDIAVHRRLLRDAAKAARGERSAGLALYAEQFRGQAQHARSKALLRAAEQAYADFAELKAFWK